ncbi:MAG: molybdenum ABC transporter ATP-binding protein [Rhodobacteraceae bacterium]|nr:molybdenum ABC transporter ATP-binding protein [Paracoccaceae bacterium]
MMLEVKVKAGVPIPLDVSFQVAAGEVLALVGASGSGKSTLLRTIAGLYQPSEARVAVNGAVWLDTGAGINLPTRRRRLGMVFQSYGLFPHMTAAGNVMAALEYLPKPERAAEAARLLALVNLGDMERRRPAELSGGQQQRVAVARALARRPEVLLLDEPFSAVDRSTREKLYQEIRNLRRVLNMPVVLVTHDMSEAQMLADRMVVIDCGRMLASGSAAEVMIDPAALRGVGLREAGSVLNARIVAHEEDGLTRLDTSAGSLLLPRIEGAAGAAVRVRIMAHEVILSRDAPQGLSALNILPVTVLALRQGDGPGMLVELQAGEETILARITQRSALAMGLQAGDACHAILKTMAVAQDNVGVMQPVI